jgi:hypothetical protein
MPTATGCGAASRIGAMTAARKRLSITEEVSTIADRNNQKCHHDWIEAFLVSHREMRTAGQQQTVQQSG